MTKGKRTVYIPKKGQWERVKRTVYIPKKGQWELVSPSSPIC